MPCTLIALKRCLFYRSCMQHGHTGNCFRPFTMMLYVLVLIHLNHHKQQSAPAVRPFPPTGHAEPARRECQPSPCKPTIVKYEPPSFNLQVPKQMYTRPERNQILQNHVIAAEATFSKVAVLEDLIQQEPHNAAHYKEVQRIQRNQHIQVAIKLQHMLEADDKLRKQQAYHS